MLTTTCRRETDMDVQWKFWRCRLRSGSHGEDALEHVAVGDPDPGTVNGCQLCRFTWAEEISQTLVLPWSCTRERGHQGQHLAGTGEGIAAVQLQLLPTATSVSV
jgi:hypothetical protein